MMTETEIEAQREVHRHGVQLAVDAYESAKANLERAKDERNRSLRDAQGPRRTGRFSYTELQQISGLSRSRLVHLIGPASDAD
jgi:hypothetical protein